MAIFDAVPRELYEQARADLAAERARADRLEQRLADLTTTAMDLKRHEIGAPPAGWAPPKSMEDELGPRTIGAIDLFAGEDAHLRRHLVNQAAIQRRAEALDNKDASPKELDTIVAEFIRRGDD